MSPVDQALATLVGWFRAALAALLGIFGVIEGFLHRVMDKLEIPQGLQGAVILVVSVLFIVVALRAFAGLLRILLIVFLILLILDVLTPLLHV